MTEPADFTEAFVAHFPRAMRVAMRLGLSPMAAEDVAAETLARACARWDTLGRADYLEAWIVRVASNLAINALSRRRSLPLITGASPSTEDEVASSIALAQELRRLPRRQREAVVLCKLEGFTEAEAGRLLGVSPNTVKTHAQRGVAALRAGTSRLLGCEA